MTQAMSPAPEDSYEINPLFLFRWEPSQNAHVLLYPEGVVKLNDSAAAILKHCSGELNVEQLIERLCAEYDASTAEQIRISVIKFLEAAHAKGWIRKAVD